mgnify:CR=1
MVYAVDKPFEFHGQEVLEVRVYGSLSLEPGHVGQPVDPRKIVPTIPSEKF